MGQINIGGKSASVQLKGNDTITSDQVFTFPNTGGELAINGGGGGGSGTTINYNGASAWGTFSGVTGEFQEGMNIEDTERTADGTYAVTFTKPISTTNNYYAVVATTNAATPRVIQIREKTSNGFKVFTRDPETGDLADGAVSFAVHSSTAIAPPHGVGADAWASVAAEGNILGSYNIASVTRRDEIYYDVVFTTPMPNGDYSVVTSTDNSGRNASYFTKVSTGFGIVIVDQSGTGAAGGFSFAVHASSTVTPTYTWTREGTTVITADVTDSVRIPGAVEFGDYKYNGTTNDGIEFESGSITSQRSEDIGGDQRAYAHRHGADITIEFTNDGSMRADRELTIGTWANNNNPAVQVGKASATTTGIVKIKGDGSNNSALSIRANGNASGAEVGSIKANGDAAFRNTRSANVLLEVERDNPDNFVSTMVDGEEQQVYSGPVLNVREILLNLQSKVQSLEAELKTLKGGAS